MRNPNPIAEVNLKKYGVPPKWEIIESLIKESGISTIYKFEQYYGLNYNHLAKVKCGQIQLGRAYWHFFYERILPERGVGFSTPQSLTQQLLTKIPKVIPTINRVATHSASVAYQPDNMTSVANVPDKSQDEHDRTKTLT